MLAEQPLGPDRRRLRKWARPRRGLRRSIRRREVALPDLVLCVAGSSSDPIVATAAAHLTSDGEMFDIPRHIIASVAALVISLYETAVRILRHVPPPGLGFRNA
jgi:hypothetical protein